MRTFFFIFVFLTSGFLIFSCYGEEIILAPSTNIEFPREVVLRQDGNEIALRATGAATRTKLFVNIYSVAHYMRKPVEGRSNGIFNDIMRDNQTKQLTIHWVRNIDEKQMQDGFKKAFKKVLKENPIPLGTEMDSFFSFFDQDIQQGDIYNIRWFPGGKIEVEVNGEIKGEMTSPEFAQTLWSIYFGPESVVSRNRLISQLKAN